MMVSVQRSIEIRVPVHTLYNQLTQFEDYPQFMQDIESVEQVDDTHLHWKAKGGEATAVAKEWDAVISEQVPDRCIAWHTESGPSNAGKVELQPVGPASSRLTLTMVTEREPEPTTPAGDVKAEMSERIWEDLARLRKLIESRGQESGAWRGEVHDEKVTAQDRSPQGQNAKGKGAGMSDTLVAELGLEQGTGETGNMAGRDGIDEVAKLGSKEGTGHRNEQTVSSAGNAGDAGIAGLSDTPVADLGLAQGTGEAGNTAGRDGLDEVAKLGSEGTRSGALPGSTGPGRLDAGSQAGQESGPVAELGVAQGMGQAGNTAGRDGIDEVAPLGSIEGMEQGDASFTTGGQSFQVSPGAAETLLRDRGSPGNPIPASGINQPLNLQQDRLGGSADPVDSANSAFKQVSMPHDADKEGSGRSDYSLTQSGAFPIAEEVSFDQQSDEARHIGQFSQDEDGDEDGNNTGVPTYDAIGKALQRGRPEPEV